MSEVQAHKGQLVQLSHFHCSLALFHSLSLHISMVTAHFHHNCSSVNLYTWWPLLEAQFIHPYTCHNSMNACSWLLYPYYLQLMIQQLPIGCFQFSIQHIKLNVHKFCWPINSVGPLHHVYRRYTCTIFGRLLQYVM